MENVQAEIRQKEEDIAQMKALFEQEKEQKFVKLIIEIIVAVTLKELYEKSDQIFKI